MRKATIVCFIITIVFSLLTILALRAKAEETNKKASTQLPLGYKDNPYVYQYGQVVDAQVFKRDGKDFTNLMVKPVGTYLLYPGDPVTLCGNHWKELDFNTDDLVIITYTRRMTHIDCHDLLRIDIIEKARKAGENGN